MEIREIKRSEIEAARCLLVASGWDRGVASSEEFERLLSQSHRVLVAVENGDVIGFLRAFCDGISNGYISMLAVAEHHRRMGIGRALVNAAMGGDRRITWVLRAAAPGAAAFYEGVGFVRSTLEMERPGARTPDA
jgi:ribosomal protein S18 acetylase RimI-like enzyme